MNVPTPVLAGNWKLHKDPAETAEFFREFLARYPPSPDRTVAFFPTALSLAAARQAVAQRADVRLGVQNVFWEPTGAFTGEISAPLARAAGAQFVLVGHSERRHVFGESIEDTRRKLGAAVEAGLRPVLCVGETLDERRADRAEAVVAAQLQGALAGLDHAAGRLLVAYEPVWAIGTGETASPADAAALHRAVRAILTRHFGAEPAAAIPILYGGSVKPDNAAELLAADQVDGVLVGGASLDAGGFARICSGSY